MKLNKYLNENKTSSIEKELDKLYENYLNNTEKIAKKVFKNIIVPFLKKREWTLIVGNGSWFFDDKNKNAMFVDDYPNDKEFQKIEKIFSIPIDGTRDSLGGIMPNYKG